jgi:hypothetical protein
MSLSTTKLTKKDKQEITASAVVAALNDYFGGVTQAEAEEVFKVLAVIAQFPGSNPPEPLAGCDVIWQSTMRVGDSLTTQRFSVQVKYSKLLFKYANPDGEPIRGIQLPDSNHINFDTWKLHADLAEKRAIAQLKF